MYPFLVLYNMSKVKKEYFCDYKYYTIYKITDGIGQVHYMATSPYLTSGCITCIGYSPAEIKAEIEKVLQRIKLLSILHRKKTKEK